MNFHDLIDDKTFNIWRYAHFYPALRESCRLTLGEGWTGEELVEGVTFKKEYDNPTGSVKDRGMAYQMSKVFEDSIREVVIPSSGNAAISASAYGLLKAIKVTAFVPQHTCQEKLLSITQKGGDVRQSFHSVSEAEDISQSLGLRNLRPSTDESAVWGFMSLGFEIYERLILRNRAISDIFLPVSSGTTLVGLGRALKVLEKDFSLSPCPRLHAVQTTAIHPIASEFDSDFRPKARSLATAICARTPARHHEVTEFLRTSRGSGWVVSENAIAKAVAWLKDRGLDSCPASAAALAGVWKAQDNGWSLPNPLVILTGRSYQQ